MSALPLVSWGDVAFAAPDGLALIDGSGCFVQLNPEAVALCGGRLEADLIGIRSPFELTERSASSQVGLLEDRSDEQVVCWGSASGSTREFAYRARRVSADPTLTVVSFRDVTDVWQRHRRLAAIARTSIGLASEGALGATLDAVAQQIVQTDGLAGVQILILDSAGKELRLLGSAGLRHWDRFLDRLLECRDRGARLCMLDAVREGKPIAVPHRWAQIRSDPVWEPLHAYLGELAWDSFVSVPLMVRGRAEGVLNAYYTPGQEIGGRTLEFLAAMAEQAALAVDYATLLQRERDGARQDERQRLARDLHDSIVQQVFSMGMQANAIGVLGGRGGQIPAAAVQQFADEVGALSQTVLADLRAMVHELRPSPFTRLGLEEAIRALLRSTENRTGLDCRSAFSKRLDMLGPELAEDVYRITAEAIHNVVKHADATTLTVRMTVRDHTLAATISDDGTGTAGDTPDTGTGADGHQKGPEGARDHGYGLTTMRERAERWGGTLKIRSRSGRGTTVRAVLPLPVQLPESVPTQPADEATDPLTVPR
ncbi:GAF domain-containing sensor histidine kinase [Streptomyces sp. NPDC005811]|uniref:sensor histidine kinase n=1 Tax=Streptomyces sp. NPDC005811 TaxID=3154565 RepID=UPI0033EF37BF